MFITSNIGAARGPGDDFWYAPASAAGSLGAGVTSESAMRLSTVYKCVRVRAETLGMLPLMVYRRRDDGGKEQVSDHPLYELLHHRPNPWQTSMQWRQMMQSHLDLRGNAYSQIVDSAAGRIDMLVPLHPDRMRTEILPNGLPRYRYSLPAGGERVFVFGELLHLAGLSADGYTGLNPIEMERDAISAAVAARDYGARYFANSARPPAWIEMPGKFATPEDRRRWVNDFAAAYGGMNSGKTPVFEGGMKLNSLTISNQDAQFLEQRKYSDIDIAGLFRMPPHKIGILDRATWGNIEHQQLDFVTDTIMPSCVAWEQAIARDLPLGPDHFVEFKLSGLLRGDTRSRYEAYGKGIQDGWMTRNEARQLENLNPLEGLDEPLEPLNMAPAGSRRAAQERGDQPTDAPSGQRQALIAAAAAERVARKEAALVQMALKADTGSEGLFAGHARFVSNVMAVPFAIAEDYVRDLVALVSEEGDQLKHDTREDFITTRVASLLRLGV